nr:40S ribosomal protein S3-1-like [Tanacetum cinerariifolium]
MKKKRRNGAKERKSVLGIKDSRLRSPLPDNVVIHMPKDDIVVAPPKEVEEYRPPLVAADEPLPKPIQA